MLNCFVLLSTAERSCSLPSRTTGKSTKDLQLKRANRQLSYFRLQAARWQKTANKKDKSAGRNLSVIRGAAKYVSGPSLAFLASQIRASQRKPGERRLSIADKQLALLLFHRSPSTYRFLSKMFAHYVYGCVVCSLNHVFVVMFLLC